MSSSTCSLLLWCLPTVVAQASFYFLQRPLIRERLLLGHKNCFEATWFKSSVCGQIMSFVSEVDVAGQIVVVATGTDVVILLFLDLSVYSKKGHLWLRKWLELMLHMHITPVLKYICHNHLSLKEGAFLQFRQRASLTYSDSINVCSTGTFWRQHSGDTVRQSRGN